MTEQTTEARRTGLPPGAAEALAAALGPRLRANRHLPEHKDRGGQEATDQALLDTAGGRELLDALWDSGMLAVPGGPPRPPLYREPPAIDNRDQRSELVADRLAPILRAEARREHPDATWVDEHSARDLVVDAGFDLVVDALWRAGLLTFEHGDDRAHLRASWAAMGGAIDALAKGRTLTADMLARVPQSHVTYLLGQQHLRKITRDAWSRLEAAKTLLGMIRDGAAVGGDLAYVRTNLAVLHGMLAGEVSWNLTQPRDDMATADAEDQSMYAEVRYRAARAAVDAEGLFAAVGETMMQAGAAVDPFVATQHLFAHRAAVYAWATAGLLRFVRDHIGEAEADVAAELVDQLGQNGEAGYVEDLPRDTDTDGGYADLLAAWTGAPGRPRPQRAAGGDAGALLAALDNAALEMWRRGDWKAGTAALTPALRELLADAADRKVATFNANARRAGHTGMNPADRWWRTDGAGPVLPEPWGDLTVGPQPEDPGDMVYLFSGGPRTGTSAARPIMTSRYLHCRTSGDAPMLIWAPADSWPGEPRYVPEGFDDRGRLVMQWRLATDQEVAAVGQRQRDRDAQGGERGQSGDER